MLTTRLLLALFAGCLSLTEAASVVERSAPRYGIGAQWLVYSQRYSFWGITGRVEMKASSAFVMLFESGLSTGPEGDDDIVFFDGAVLAALGPVGEKTYVGLGVGLARWQDKKGWDTGTWYQIYKKLTVAKDFSLMGSWLFFQASLLYDSWFNFNVVVGIWF